MLGPHCPLPLAATLAEVERPLEAVDEAAKCDLLHLSQAQAPWTVSFPHPLVRAAVYDELGPARRHALHVAAAALLTDDAVSLRHRVAAAAEPDERLADDLTRFADSEARRQAWQSAAAHLVAASRLSLDPEEAQRRVLRAVVWTLLRGDAATASTFADEIATFTSSPLRDSVLGSLAMAADDPVTAERLLAAAWDARGPGADPEVDATIALMTAIHSLRSARRRGRPSSGAAAHSTPPPRPPGSTPSPRPTSSTGWATRAARPSRSPQREPRSSSRATTTCG